MSFWPSAASTSSKTARACGKASASALPMPTAWLALAGKDERCGHVILEALPFAGRADLHAAKRRLSSQCALFRQGIQCAGLASAGIAGMKTALRCFRPGAERKALSSSGIHDIAGFSDPSSRVSAFGYLPFGPFRGSKGFAPERETKERPHEWLSTSMCTWRART